MLTFAKGLQGPERKRITQIGLLALFVVLFVLQLVACGGTGSNLVAATSHGGLLMNVKWPTEDTRVIPSNAQSIVVEVHSLGNLVKTHTIIRPDASASFVHLPVGDVTVTATAYPNADGTGTALAQASAIATIIADDTITVNLTLTSTVEELNVSPSPLIIAAGQTAQLTVTALDDDGNVVLLPPGAITFSSSDPSVVTVDADGLVTALNTTGTAVITVTDTISGQQFLVNVTSVVGVAITPNNPTQTVGRTINFSATVSGTGNQSVTWTVVEGASGGTITAGGLYTAPSTSGTYHVRATSVADPSQSSTVTVTVTSGGAVVSID